MSFEPPKVLMVLDHSGSMYNFNIAPSTTRWAGLVQVVDTVTQNYEDRIDFGVKWFPSTTTECTSTGGKCNVSSTFDVAPAPSNNGPIMTALNAMTNLGSCSTPIQSAMEQSLVALQNGIAPGEVGAFMLIIDGGVATFCSGNTEAGTVAAVTAARNAGYNTYVVGIGVSASASEPDSYAVAGGVPNPDPLYDYYPGDNLTQLNTALDAIASDLATCVIDLSNSAPNPDLTEVSVDGVDYPQIMAASCASSDGWYYSNGSYSQITLCGAACDAFKIVATAEVEYFCTAG